MTSPKKVRNIPASVRQRPLNLAHDQGDDFQALLQRYAAERFLYRLSASAEAGRYGWTRNCDRPGTWIS